MIDETKTEKPARKKKRKYTRRAAKRARGTMTSRREDGLKVLRANSIRTAIDYLQAALPEGMPLILGKPDDYKYVAILGALASLRRIPSP